MPTPTPTWTLTLTRTPTPTPTRMLNDAMVAKPLASDITEIGAKLHGLLNCDVKNKELRERGTKHFTIRRAEYDAFFSAKHFTIGRSK